MKKENLVEEVALPMAVDKTTDQEVLATDEILMDDTIPLLCPNYKVPCSTLGRVMGFTMHLLSMIDHLKRELQEYREGSRGPGDPHAANTTLPPLGGRPLLEGSLPSLSLTNSGGRSSE